VCHRPPPPGAARPKALILTVDERIDYLERRLAKYGGEALQVTECEPRGKLFRTIMLLERERNGGLRSQPSPAQPKSTSTEAAIWNSARRRWSEGRQGARGRRIGVTWPARALPLARWSAERRIHSFA
jgi:hypothetical protein